MQLTPTSQTIQARVASLNPTCCWSSALRPAARPFALSGLHGLGDGDCENDGGGGDDNDDRDADEIVQDEEQQVEEVTRTRMQVEEVTRTRMQTRRWTTTGCLSRLLTRVLLTCLLSCFSKVTFLGSRAPLVATTMNCFRQIS